MVELKSETENWLEKVILKQWPLASRDYLIVIFQKNCKDVKANTTLTQNMFQTQKLTV